MKETKQRRIDLTDDYKTDIKTPLHLSIFCVHTLCSTHIHMTYYSSLFNKKNPIQIKLIHDSIKDTCCCYRQALSIKTLLWKKKNTVHTSSWRETKIVWRRDRHCCDREGERFPVSKGFISLFLSAPSLSDDTNFLQLMRLKTRSFTFLIGELRLL